MSEESDGLFWMNPKTHACHLAAALFLASGSIDAAISFARAEILEDQIPSGFLAVMFGIGAVGYARIAVRAKK